MSQENDRERRIRKRTEGLNSIQRTPAYILARLHGITLPELMPDPLDESISKRKWEKSMMTWRAALREALKEIHGKAVAEHQQTEGCTT